ncbi:MAG: SGNH/GDSL hydrolase family protein [Burkholderiales bacterium]
MAIVLAAAAYETVQNLRYERWRKAFDNAWFGRMTVPSPNPVLMWEYRPYGEVGQLKMNRYGFRDRDYTSTAKPANTYRIAFIGDSVTLGLQVDVEETFVRRFEAAANERGRKHRIQALNFAIDGYNTPQIYELLRTKTLHFAPDKVVYMLCMNDFDFQESADAKIRYFKKPPSFLLAALERFYGYRILGLDFHQFHFRKNKKIVYEKILDMKAMLERERISFQVILLPVFPDAATDFEKYPIRNMHSEIGLFLEENRIPYFDLLEAFKESGKPPKFYSLDMWHPNTEGHRLIAQKSLGAILAP